MAKQIRVERHRTDVEVQQNKRLIKVPSNRISVSPSSNQLRFSFSFLKAKKSAKALLLANDSLPDDRKADLRAKVAKFLNRKDFTDDDLHAILATPFEEFGEEHSFEKSSNSFTFLSPSRSPSLPLLLHSVMKILNDAFSLRGGLLTQQ